jgi:hypothetical protein
MSLRRCPVTALLRFSPGFERDPDVAAWFARQPTALRALVDPWFACMRAAGPDVRELVHDGCPVVCVDAAPFAYVNIFTAHANVGFFHGAALPDPARLLEGTGKYMRHVKLRPAGAVNHDALAALIAAAYADIRARIAHS